MGLADGRIVADAAAIHEGARIRQGMMVVDGAWSAADSSIASLPSADRLLDDWVWCEVA